MKSTTTEKTIVILVQVKQGNQALQGKSRGDNKDLQVRIDSPNLSGIPKVNS